MKEGIVKAVARKNAVTPHPPIHEVILDRCEQLLREIVAASSESGKRIGPQFGLWSQSNMLGEYISLINEGFIPVKELTRIETRLTGMLDQLTGIISRNDSYRRYLVRPMSTIRETLAFLNPQRRKPTP